MKMCTLQIFGKLLTTPHFYSNFCIQYALRKEANLNKLFGIEGKHGVDSSKRVDGVIQEEQLPDESIRAKNTENKSEP